MVSGEIFLPGMQMASFLPRPPMVERKTEKQTERMNKRKRDISSSYKAKVPSD